MKKKSAITVAIILMSIGFAAVSTTLILNGNAKISEGIDDFDIYFSKALIDNKDVYKSVVSHDKKSITFTTSELKTLGQTSMLTYEVTNNSSNYDAEVQVNCKVKDNTTAKYTSIKNEFDGNATKVLAKETLNGTLTVTLNKTTTEEIKENYICELTFNAVERNSIGIDSIYKEKILNGADPILTSDLIPVTIKDNGTVTYADVKKEWYSYEDKVWANAVILKNESSYNIGDVIDDADIKQYYVWIPRYRYQLWNADGVTTTASEKAINIVFENKRTKVSNGIQNGEWLTHPAFTTFDINGMWIGKFETSYDEETFIDSSKFLTTNPNISVANDASNIIIKPNVRSLTNKNVSTFYTLGRKINVSLNSHMMKNMEWGATSYLTYSLYGKCTTSGCEEVYINNVNTGYLGATAKFSGQWEYSASITGCGGETASAAVNSNQSSCATGYAYNESNNKSSTTGNISGIYDMAGGSNEYVTSGIQDDNGNPISGNSSRYNSGFNGIYGTEEASRTNGINFPTDSKYYDLYTPNSKDLNDDTWYKYQNGSLGDAIKEVTIDKENSTVGSKSLWFNDAANFASMKSPWFMRGGCFHYGATAGIFNSGRHYGNGDRARTFRVVLAV